MYSPMGGRTSTISRKNMTVINFAQSRVSIDFSRTMSEFQNTGHSKCIMGSRRSTISRKNETVINLVQSRV
ncbi:hypothetical protein GW17_00054849 [Ensete ventricosum]|nr:hypothetical protein GW17_00054849 [Ensete ventricosum]RZR87116.1 hypothetical protein BHM03_00014434 [Ensete ventricosum]